MRRPWESCDCLAWRREGSESARECPAAMAHTLITGSRYESQSCFEPVAWASVNTRFGWQPWGQRGQRCLPYLCTQTQASLGCLVLPWSVVMWWLGKEGWLQREARDRSTRAGTTFSSFLSCCAVCSTPTFVPHLLQERVSGSCFYWVAQEEVSWGHAPERRMAILCLCIASLK